MTDQSLSESRGDLKTLRRGLRLRRSMDSLLPSGFLKRYKTSIPWSGMPSRGSHHQGRGAGSGVSLGTASNVISGHRRVSDELRERVEAAISRLGYKPNAIAASLRRKQTRTIGLILPSLQNTFFVEVADALEDLAVADGYEIIMAVTKESPERTINHIRTLAARRVDGITAIPTIESPLALAELKNLAHPTVIIDRIEDENDFPSVAIENREAGRLGTEHLLALGHQQIAFIVNSANLANGRNRVAGFWDAVKAAKVEARCQSLVVGMTDEDAYQHVLELLQRPDWPTALFTPPTSPPSARCARYRRWASGYRTTFPSWPSTIRNSCACSAPLSAPSASRRGASPRKAAPDEAAAGRCTGRDRACALAGRSAHSRFHGAAGRRSREDRVTM